MITGGDEHLRSLNCNNNPYNLDSVGNWLIYIYKALYLTFWPRIGQTSGMDLIERPNRPAPEGGRPRSHYKV
jgi:hypothetical protein